MGSQLADIRLRLAIAMAVAYVISAALKAREADSDAEAALALQRAVGDELAEFRDVLCELRLRVEEVRNRFLEYQRAVDRIYIRGSAPREAILEVDALVKTNLGELDDLF
jgi:hypothetical protein